MQQVLNFLWRLAEQRVLNFLMQRAMQQVLNLNQNLNHRYYLTHYLLQMRQHLQHYHQLLINS
jgi:hypothetical protein